MIAHSKIKILDVLQQRGGITWKNETQGVAHCPTREDRNASLHVTLQQDPQSGRWKVLLYDHGGSSVAEILAALGLLYSDLFESVEPSSFSAGKAGAGEPKLVKVYDYHDADGNVLHQTLRWEPKNFTQRRRAEPNQVYQTGGKEYRSFRDPRGNWWINTLKGIEPVIYRLPEILKADLTKLIFQCEGEKDADNLRKAFGVYTTTVPMGSGKWRTSYNPFFKGRRVFLIPDFDKPRKGQTDPAANAGFDGARRVAAELVKVAAEVRIVYLPDLGKLTPKWDLSNWIEAGGTKEQFLEACNAAPILHPDHSGLIPAGMTADDAAAASSSPAGSEAGDKLRQITNVIETAEGHVPLPMAKILDSIRKTTNDWPRRVGRSLFIYENARVDFLTSASQLFGWLGSRLSTPPTFSRSSGCHSKTEVYDEFCRTAQQYESIERYPHVPKLPDRFYAFEELPEGDGKHLSELLNRFSPADDESKQLLLAFCLTLVSGCRKRPLFVIRADGRGAGKTTVAELLFKIVGGCLQVGSNESDETLKARLLSIEGLEKRGVLLDNVKSRKLSWAGLESLITSETISGKQMYVGEASRPNNLIWVITVNGPAFSQDMAQRSVVINIQRAQYSEDWERDTAEFVTIHQRKILADICWYLSSDRIQLARYTRWADWESEVLCRLPNPEAVQRAIVTRQREIDVDQTEGSMIERHFEKRLAELNYLSDEPVHIPCEIVAQWLFEATGDRLTKAGATQNLNEKIESGIITRLAYKKAQGERGFIWSNGWDSGKKTKTDVLQRIRIESRELRNDQIQEDTRARLEASIGGRFGS